MPQVLERSQSTWRLNMEPGERAASDKNPKAVSNNYAYVKYLDPCTNKGTYKHPEKEVVSVKRFHKARPENLQLQKRSYRIQCGENDNLCRASISLLGESRDDIKAQREKKRPVFPPSRNLAEGTEVSSAAEDRLAKNKKKSAENVAMKEKVRALAIKKIGSLQSLKKKVKSDTESSERLTRKDVTEISDNVQESDSTANDSGFATSSDGSRRVTQTRLPAKLNKKMMDTSRFPKKRNPSSKVGSREPLTLGARSVNIGKDTTNNDGEHAAKYSEDILESRCRSAKPQVVSKSLVQTKKKCNPQMQSTTKTGSIEAGKKNRVVRNAEDVVLQSSKDDTKCTTRSPKPATAKPVTKPKRSDQKINLTRNIGNGSSTSRGSMGRSIKNTVDDDASTESSSDNTENTRSTKPTITKSVPKKKIKLSGSNFGKLSTTGLQSMEMMKDKNTTGRESNSSMKDHSGLSDAEKSACESASSDGSPVPSPSPPPSDGDEKILSDNAIMTYNDFNLSKPRFDDAFRSNLNEVVRMMNEGEGDEPVERMVSMAGPNEIAKVIRRLKLENRSLRSLNLQLQRDHILDCDKIAATIGKIDVQSRQYVKKRIQTGEDLDIGLLDETTGMIHAGYGKWVKFVEYSKYCKPKPLKPVSASKFMGNMARLMFTDEILRKSSVTGTQSNAWKDKSRKPALDPVGLDAIAAITRYWMKQQEKSEEEIIKEVSKLTTVLAKKIADLNRPKRVQGDAQKKKKKKAAEAAAAADDSATEIDESEDEGMLPQQSARGHDTDPEATDDDTKESVVDEASEIFTESENKESESEEEGQLDTSEKDPKEPEYDSMEPEKSSAETEQSQKKPDNSPDRKKSGDGTRLPLAPRENAREDVPDLDENPLMTVDQNIIDASEHEHTREDCAETQKNPKKHSKSSDEDDTSEKPKRQKIVADDKLHEEFVSESV